jgi:uncharacterized sulfatase
MMMEKKRIERRTILKMGALAGAAVLGYPAAASLKGILGKLGGTPSNAGETPRGLLIPKNKNFNGKQPNIILINCDDLGYGDLGCYGNQVIRTPHIDKLAGEGVRFTDFYASCSVCTPSRYSLLTGRYPIRSGLIFVLPALGESLSRYVIRTTGRWLGRLGAVDVQDDSYVSGLPDEEITLGKALKTAGYKTGMVGKWHLGDFSKEPKHNPRRHGFDEFFGVPHSNDMFPCALYRNETQLEADIGLNQARLTGLYTKEAIDFINKSPGTPFFLYLAHTFPHQPLYASEKFKDRSKAGIFGDAVEEIDWSLGEIVRCLREKGLENNTIIFFTSDNGPWYNGNPGGFRGRKGQSYEGGFRIPLIVKWPGRIPAGTVCAEASMNLDLFPTLLPLAGLELPPDRIIDGKNIDGLLMGKEKRTPHDVLYFYHYEELEGVRAGNWKYFRNINHYVWPQPVDKKTTLFGRTAEGNFGDWPNLYNIEYDKGENYNLASRYPEVVRKLDDIMTTWETGIKKNPGGWIKGKP